LYCCLGYNRNKDSLFLDLDTSLKKNKSIFFYDLKSKSDLSLQENLMFKYFNLVNDNSRIKDILFNKAPDLRLVSCIKKSEYKHIGMFRKNQNKKYKLINIIDNSLLEDKLCLEKVDTNNFKSYFIYYQDFIKLLNTKEYNIKIKDNKYSNPYFETINLKSILIKDQKFNSKKILNCRKLLNSDEPILSKVFFNCINEFKIYFIEEEFKNYIKKILNIDSCDVIIHIKEFNYITQIKL